MTELRRVLLSSAILAGSFGCHSQTPTPNRETFVTVAPGIRLHYQVVGKGVDTLLVLHGGPAFGYSYMAGDLEPLTRQHTLIFYDQRGSGRSTLVTGSAQLDIARQVEDINALLEHFRIERVNLLGHSWGGMLAARYAAAYPDHVAKVILVEPMRPSSAFQLLPVQQRLDSTSMQKMTGLFRSLDTAPDPVAVCRQVFSRELAFRSYFADSTVVDRLHGDFCDRPPEALRAWNTVVRGIFQSLGAWDVRPLLAKITAPVLIIRGTQSAISLPSMHAWLTGLPNARLVEFEKAGHYLYAEQPDRFAKVVNSFLQGGVK